MKIEKLLHDYASMNAFSAFMDKMWPVRFGSEDWETIVLKYFDHPDADLCPGTGLYACLEGSEIYGIMGSCPFPVVRNGEIHPGHMLVDWPVPERYRGGPVAGKLFAALVELPGRKYASHGSAQATAILQRRAFEVPRDVVAAPLSAAKSVILQAFSLLQVARAAATPAALRTRSGEVELFEGAAVGSSLPVPPLDAVHVYHSQEFWGRLGLARRRTGVVELRIRGDEASGVAILQLQAAGKIRFATLLAISAENPGNKVSAGFGKVFKEALERTSNQCAARYGS